MTFKVEMETVLVRNERQIKLPSLPRQFFEMWRLTVTYHIQYAGQQDISKETLQRTEMIELTQWYEALVGNVVEMVLAYLVPVSLFNCPSRVREQQG